MLECWSHLSYHCTDFFANKQYLSVSKDENRGIFTVILWHAEMLCEFHYASPLVHTYHLNQVKPRNGSADWEFSSLSLQWLYWWAQPVVCGEQEAQLYYKRNAPCYHLRIIAKQKCTMHSCCWGFLNPTYHWLSSQVQPLQRERRRFQISRDISRLVLIQVTCVN